MTTEDSAPRYLIVSCDGGGIRGLITALLLDRIDCNANSFLQQTYLFSGTSTGGIIALALAAGLSPSQLVTLYSQDGAQIFTPSACFGSSEVSKIREAVASSGASLGSIWGDILEYLADLVCVKYDNGGLKSVINSTLGSKASATIGSLDRKVLVTSFQLYKAQADSWGQANSWAPLVFHNVANNPTANTQIIDAAMSTSAAPTYFPPYNHPTFGYCADGGVVANNPAALAASMLMESGIPREQIWMLSLSTGDTVNSYPPSLVGGTYGPYFYGPFFWLFPVAQTSTQNGKTAYTPSMPLTSAVFDGVSDINDYVASKVLAPGQYMRANVPLDTPVALDDYSPQAIQAMTDAVSTYTNPNNPNPEWVNIIKWIKSNFSS